MDMNPVGMDKKDHVSLKTLFSIISVMVIISILVITIIIIIQLQPTITDVKEINENTKIISDFIQNISKITERNNDEVRSSNNILREIRDKTNL